MAGITPTPFTIDPNPPVANEGSMSGALNLNDSVEVNGSTDLSESV